MSSNDCDGDKTLFSVAFVPFAVVPSSLAKVGMELLSLMLFIVAATLGIALKQRNKTIL